LTALAAHFGHNLRNKRLGRLLWLRRLRGWFRRSYGLQDDSAGILDGIEAFACPLWHALWSHAWGAIGQAEGISN